MLRAMGTLGVYVRERRKALGLNLDEVAKKSGLKVGGLSMIETGKRRRVSPDTILKLAVGLDDEPGNILRLAANGDGAAKGEAE